MLPPIHTPSTWKLAGAGNSDCWKLSNRSTPIWPC
jgi:hypothetical protein